MQDSSNFNFPCVDGFLKYVVTLLKEGNKAQLKRDQNSN